MKPEVLGGKMRTRCEIAWSVLCAAALALSLTPAASGEDLTGRWGAGGAIGPTFPIGSDQIKSNDDVGLGGGGWLGYGLNRRFSARVGYDNYDPPCAGPTPLAAPSASGSSGKHDVSVELVHLTGAYALAPDSAWNPSVRVGVGPAWVHGVQGMNKDTKLGVTAGVGVDRFVTHEVSVGAAVDWVGVMGSGPTDVHMLRPGVTAGYWFGGK